MWYLFLPMQLYGFIALIFPCICYRKIMVKRLKTARRVTTSTQRLRISAMLFKMDEYRMEKDDDMITHIIKFNDMLQESIWAGNWIGQPTRFRMLRNTLPEMWQSRLTDIWESVTFTEELSVQYNVAIKKFVIEYIRLKAKNATIPMISRGYRPNSKFAGLSVGFPWLPKIDYKLPKEFKDSFPKTMIRWDTETGKVLNVRY